jgi:hypothetical protein
MKVSFQHAGRKLQVAQDDALTRDEHVDRVVRGGGGKGKSKRKQLAIVIVKKLVGNHPLLKPVLMNTPKKDDLADALLHALYVLHVPSTSRPLKRDEILLVPEVRLSGESTTHRIDGFPRQRFVALKTL